MSNPFDTLTLEIIAELDTAIQKNFSILKGGTGNIIEDNTTHCELYNKLTAYCFENKEAICKEHRLVISTEIRVAVEYILEVTRLKLKYDAESAR